MARLWLSGPALGALCVGMGCSGRDVSGAWTGRLPFVGADDCRIRMYRGGTFDFACAGPDPWVGGGKFALRGDWLRLEFFTVGKGAQTLQSPPAPLEAQVSGLGNAMELKLDDGRRLSWKRTAE